MDILIREYNKDDGLSLLSISNDEWKFAINNIVMLMENENSVEKCLVAEVKGHVVGFIYGFVLPNKTLIPELIYVTPDFRKYGIATKLIKRLESISGCTAAMIFYNKSLHNFYEHQGYQLGDNLEVAMKPIEGIGENEI